MKMRAWSPLLCQEASNSMSPPASESTAAQIQSGRPPTLQTRIIHRYKPPLICETYLRSEAPNPVPYR
jgi:hypothetical protein